MLLVNIALFVHLLGVVTLFSALAIVQRSGARARRATTVEEARIWLDFAGATRSMFLSSFLMILISGLYMAHKEFAFSTPWIMVAITAVLLLPLIGGLGVGRTIKGVERVLGTASGPVTSEQSKLLRSPAPWVLTGILNGLAVGLLWIMVNKPGLTHTFIALALTTFLGAVMAMTAVRSAR